MRSGNDHLSRKFRITNVWDGYVHQAESKVGYRILMGIYITISILTSVPQVLLLINCLLISSLYSSTKSIREQLQG